MDVKSDVDYENEQILSEARRLLGLVVEAAEQLHEEGLSFCEAFDIMQPIVTAVFIAQLHNKH